MRYFKCKDCGKDWLQMLLTKLKTSCKYCKSTNIKRII